MGGKVYLIFFKARFRQIDFTLLQSFSFLDTFNLVYVKASQEQRTEKSQKASKKNGRKKVVPAIYAV